MTKKIVIKMQMNCAKCRSKALKIAAQAQGVISMALEGEDQVVVTGDEVDPVCLTNVLRKKFRCAKLLTVEDVKGNEGEVKGKGKDGGEEIAEENEETKPKDICYCQFPPPCHAPVYYHVVYDPYPNICSIM